MMLDTLNLQFLTMARCSTREIETLGDLSKLNGDMQRLVHEKSMSALGLKSNWKQVVPLKVVRGLDTPGSGVDIEAPERRSRDKTSPAAIVQ